MFCPVRMVSVVDNVILLRIYWSRFTLFCEVRGEIYNVQTLRSPCTLALIKPVLLSNKSSSALLSLYVMYLSVL